MVSLEEATKKHAQATREDRQESIKADVARVFRHRSGIESCAASLIAREYQRASEVYDQQAQVERVLSLSPAVDEILRIIDPAPCAASAAIRDIVQANELGYQQGHLERLVGSSSSMFRMLNDADLFQKRFRDAALLQTLQDQVRSEFSASLEYRSIGLGICDAQESIASIMSNESSYVLSIISSYSHMQGILDDLESDESGDDIINSICDSDAIDQRYLQHSQLTKIIRENAGIKETDSPDKSRLLPLGRKTVDGRDPADCYLMLLNQSAFDLIQHIEDLTRATGASKVRLVLPERLSKSKNNQSIDGIAGFSVDIRVHDRGRGELTIPLSDIAGQSIQIESPRESNERLSKTYQESKPDSLLFTKAKVWTTKDKSLHLSTETRGAKDGDVIFPYGNTGPTKQMQLMRLLIFKWCRGKGRQNKGAKVLEIIEQVYPERLEGLSLNKEEVGAVMKCIRSLFSDIRNKKLAPSGINPDILPALDVDITTETRVTLNLKYLIDLDEEKDFQE